jgi:hypothetical protein
MSPENLPTHYLTGLLMKETFAKQHKHEGTGKQWHDFVTSTGSRESMMGGSTAAPMCQVGPHEEWLGHGFGGC